MSEKIKLLYLCTGNSCRSQMAEGWTRALKGDQIEVYSAGIETHGLNPNAVKVMGVDPETILPEVDRVGNGFISIVGYQAQGYSVVTIK